MKRKPIIIFGAVAALLAVYFSLAFLSRTNLQEQYEAAENLMEQSKYDDAIKIFQQLGPEYKDSLARIAYARLGLDYNDAQKYYENEEYKKAAEIFKSLGDFKDSNELAIESTYQYAITLFNEALYEEALANFQELGDYQLSKLYAAKCSLELLDEMQERIYKEATRLYDCQEYDEALQYFEELGDFEDSVAMVQKCKDMVNRIKLSTTISAGQRYSLGITSYGDALSTGYNPYGQSNIEGWSDLLSISGQGVVSIGLKADGTVVTAGVGPGDSIDTSEWKNIIAVSAGERYVAGLKNDGTVECQGHGNDGQTDTGNWTDVVAIATGWRHTVGLCANGEIKITGYRASNQLKEIANHQSEWQNIIAIAAGGGGTDADIGRGHTVGLREDKTVVAVGDNQYGQCDVGNWTDIVAIAAGQWHTVGLHSDGTVIPPKKNRKEQRDYDKYLYKLRHLVENCFLTLKRWRGIATRYAKTSEAFIAAVHVRCIAIWAAIRT